MKNNKQFNVLFYSLFIMRVLFEFFDVIIINFIQKSHESQLLIFTLVGTYNMDGKLILIS